jgi:hypothetical protein
VSAAIDSYRAIALEAGKYASQSETSAAKA